MKYFILLFPFSLSSIGFLSNLRITVADVAILIVISYVLLIKKKIAKSNLFIISSIFFLLLFVVNFFNIIIVDDLNVSRVLTSYLKLIIFSLILLTFPIIISYENLKSILKATILIITFHSIIMLIDVTIGMPISIEEHLLNYDGIWEPMYRPNGLFGEPSFFGIFVLIFVGLIMQFELNTKIHIIKFWHFIIISLGLFVTKSITCYLSLLILFLYYFYKHFSYKIIFTSFSVLIILYITTIYQIDLREGQMFEMETFMSKTIFDKFILTFKYYEERVLNLLTLNDGSSSQRLIGSFLYTLNILEQRPILGSGIGGNNLELIIKDKDFYSIDYRVYNTLYIVPITYSNTTFYAFIIGSGGVLSLIYFYFIFWGNLFFTKKTRFYAILILISGLTYGGVLESQFWVSIAVCIVLKEKTKIKA